MKVLKTLIFTNVLLVFIASFSFLNIYGETIVDISNPIEIVTSQAWYDADSMISGSYLPEGIDNDAQLVISCANYLKDSLTNITNVKSFIRNEYELGDNTFEFEDFFNSLEANQIVIWQGHGTWNGENEHSVLWTGRLYDESKLATNQDYQDGSIVNAQGNEAITYKYILKHSNNLDNSLIYLGQCEGGYDPVLAQAFLDKGAAAVVANTKIISAPYSDMMQYTTIKLLAENKTISQALNEAKTIYGNDDSVMFGGLGAEPIIFGNDNYKISQFKINQNLFYTGETQYAIPTNDGYSIINGSESDVGNYIATLSLNPGYIWSDDTYTDITIDWNISKAYTKPTDFELPKYESITYDGNIHKLLTLNNPNSNLYFALQDEFGNVGSYSNNIPELSDAGYYYVNWYLEGDETHTGYGSTSCPIVYPANIYPAEYENEQVIMNDYLYGHTPSIPKMTHDLDLDIENTITYYYDIKDATTSSKKWTKEVSETLKPGTYYIYAVIKRNNYNDYVSPTTRFHIYDKWPKPSSRPTYIIPKTGIK